GDLSADQSGLLLRFLDPALAEDLPALPAPRDPDPLTYRIYEAIGEPQSITRLPLAFAATQLDGDGGWKAQIDATERLTRAGSLPPARLLEVYGARRPAASGGVWDRVAAVQALRRALAGDDIAAQVTASARAFETLRPAGLAVVLARGMAADLPGLTSLAGVDLGGAASDVATLAHMHLLSDDYELAARALPPDLGAHLPNHALLVAIAQGQSAQPLGGNRHATAIATAFAMRPALPEVDALVADMRLGEAIVIAMAQVNAGAMGDGRALTQGLRSLRSLGLEDLARRTALELLILDPLQ
ncbi:MAG: hypothetical protein ACPGFC_04650, partial [Paracoccaceae bacterium]